MNRTSVTTLVCLAAIAALTGCAHDHHAGKAQDNHAMQLPPGWTEADMQACIEAGTPGAMHQWMAQGVGTWKGNCQMWMAPGTEPMSSEVTSTIKPMMDGRYNKCEMKGDMPGMGPYTGYGVSGFDNVSQKFVSTWIDNHSTGIMNGTGTLSSDQRVLTMNYTFNCPLNKKPTVMREVSTFTGTDTMTIEMFTTDPKNGREYKMMNIDFTRR